MGEWLIPIAWKAIHLVIDARVRISLLLPKNILKSLKKDLTFKIVYDIILVYKIRN